MMDGKKANVENCKAVALTMTLGKNPQVSYEKVCCETSREVSVATGGL